MSADVATYDEARHRIVREFGALPPNAPIRLTKPTSNLFRLRDSATGAGLDTSGIDTVISVDPQSGTADVGGMTTYEDLVDATLPYGLMPTVVPQLKTITLGGAVAGLGIESTAFRNGLPHEAVREMDVLTGSGEVVTAQPDGEHGDLFRAFPNSYGTLGYALRLLIDLEPVCPYVRLRHIGFAELDDLTQAVDDIVKHRSFENEPVDFLDGTIFGAGEAYLTLGTWAEGAPYTSDYTGMQIYYRSIRSCRVDYLSVRDYLWRWDTDWFWCSRAFGAQHPVIRRLWPKRWLRSDVYWKLVRLAHDYDIVDRRERWRGRPPCERVVQDVEIPLERTADFVNWFLQEVPITPIWLCPLRLRPVGDAGDGSDEPPWPLYPLRAGRTYVNVGFWSTVPIVDGAANGDVNRRIEQAVSELGGHKSLYSDAYYSEDEFWRRYGGATYRDVKQRYDPAGRLLDLYAKAVKRR
jgi:FAD/FMN-containing dehydrogenase